MMMQSIPLEVPTGVYDGGGTLVCLSVECMLQLSLAIRDAESVSPW